MRRIWSLLWLGFLGLLFMACAKTSAGEKNDGPPDIPPPPPAASASGSAARTDVAPSRSEGFQTSGTASAARTSQLAAKGSGILRSIKVREGDRVKAGQVLCVLDASNASLRSEAARADHAQAIAALEDAKRDMDRVEQLADAGALPEQTMDKARLGMRIAKLRADAAAVGVRMAQQSLADATLRAPFDGVITKVLSEEGQYVTSMPPSPVFILVDTDALEVRISIPERKISQIRVGQPVRVELPAVNVTREAKVDRMAEVIDPVTRSAEVLIRLDNKDRSLPAGLFARVTFPEVVADAMDDSAPSKAKAPTASAADGR
jgi:membrane fusion protein, multidrug efflux system